MHFDSTLHFVALVHTYVELALKVGCFVLWSCYDDELRTLMLMWCSDSFVLSVHDGWFVYSWACGTRVIKFSAFAADVKSLHSSVVHMAGQQNDDHQDLWCISAGLASQFQLQ